MQNLFNFLAKHHFFILFVFLELFCVYLIVQNNDYQKAKFINSANAVTGGTYKAFSNITDFVSLKQENEKLALENAQLRNKANEVHYVAVPTYLNDTVFVMDTIILDSAQLFNYLPAKVISNSINKQHNVVYLNKGMDDGLNVGMGVVDSKGVVGVITSTSPKFAMVMPVVNQDFNLSVRIKRLGYFGNLSWNGWDPKVAQLTDIPNHIKPKEGDTIVTSGYSNVFPENIVVGFVRDSETEMENGFLNISVTLASDFGKLDYVYAIENKLKEDFNQLLNE